MNMLRKISFSEVCKRLTDEGWGFDVYYGRDLPDCGRPYILRGEYDNGYYGSKTIAISFSHILPEKNRIHHLSEQVRRNGR